MAEQEKILIVEDNNKLASYIKTCLEGCGYKVNHISQGDKAVYRIIKDKPDLVLLDIMLPGMNGKQICLSVRSEYLGKIIMLTALNDTTTEVDSLNLGADDYICKPIKTEVLIARISAVLRRPTLKNSRTTISYGALVIDTIKHEVCLNNAVIDLKPREYDLLLLFANNVDCVLSRDNITQALYGHEYDGVDRGIDLKISSLRTKLQDNPKKPYRIKTIHGKGYTLLSSAWE
jgi:two-component system response regulator RstA